MSNTVIFQIVGILILLTIETGWLKQVRQFVKQGVVNTVVKALGFKSGKR